MLLAMLGMLVLWIGWDLARTGHHDLRVFDSGEVARLETSMWKAYYAHERWPLFRDLATLLRRQYGMSYWRSWEAAYRGARAAVVFQAGHSREDYLRALPELERFYGMIRQGSLEPFDVHRAAALEVQWWIVHRERAQYNPNDLVQALAELQAAIYRKPTSLFLEHAKLRADAMLLRDARAEAGGVSAEDWGRIGRMLDGSWGALGRAVAP